MGGLNGLTGGAATDANVKKAALTRAKAAGFRGA
jgi:urease subunit gamma/beta